MIWRKENGAPAPKEAMCFAMEAQRRFSVPAGILLATAECESGFRLGVVSGADAVGPMQFLPRYKADYVRYAGFDFELEGWGAILGAGAVFARYAKWGRQRHGLCGEDMWRYALSVHRYGQNSKTCLNFANKRVRDVEKHMRRNGLWYAIRDELPQRAADWALEKRGCRYSQEERMAPDAFDCSSLAARAYAAQGVSLSAPAPVSCRLVYEDCFRLLWPESYDQIGRRLGGKQELSLAQEAGDLQFLCTDKGTSRKNKITHVAVVLDEKSIVHARSARYGVCVNERELYAGRVCALLRYDPNVPLQKGMRGARVKKLQQALCAAGEKIKIDGVFGDKTQAALLRHPEEITC